MQIFDRLISHIAPHDCLSCGEEGGLMCAWCAAEAFTPVPSRCFSCHSMTKEYEVCVRCRRRTKLTHLWIAAEYEGLAERLVKAYKFDSARSAAAILAETMAESLPYLEPNTVVTHIPTATSRRRQRGYDQSELLAKEIAKRKGLKFIPLLARMGHSRQVGATRTERQKQISGSFRAIHIKNIRHTDVLLVDDIVTTGATLGAAAAALRSAGARKIYGAVFAQKM